MQKDFILDYAGDLSIEKLIPDAEQIESAYTQTNMCGTFFTLICC